MIFLISWEDIAELVKDAAVKKDPIAQHIKQLKLETNQISLLLSDPYVESDENNSDDSAHLPSMVVDIDLGLSAFANARK